MASGVSGAVREQALFQKSAHPAGEGKPAGKKERPVGASVGSIPDDGAEKENLIRLSQEGYEVQVKACVEMPRGEVALGESMQK